MDLKTLVDVVNDKLDKKSGAKAVFKSGIFDDKIIIVNGDYDISITYFWQAYSFKMTHRETGQTPITGSVKLEMGYGIENVVDIINTLLVENVAKSDDEWDWKQYVKAVIDKETLDDVLSGSYTDFTEEEMDGAPKEFYTDFKKASAAYNALDEYISAHDLVDTEDDASVSDERDNEGLDYGVTNKGYKWDGVKDEKFHKLLSHYITKRDQFLITIR